MYRCLFTKGVVLSLVMLTSYSLALAQSPDARIWASQCFQCHGTNGAPVGDMDEIGGKDAQSLYEDLLEMKYRGRTEDIMDLHARGYTDAQLRAIAEYISQLPKTERDKDEKR